MEQCPVCFSRDFPVREDCGGVCFNCFLNMDDRVHGMYYYGPNQTLYFKKGIDNVHKSARYYSAVKSAVHLHQNSR